MSQLINASLQHLLLHCFIFVAALLPTSCIARACTGSQALRALLSSCLTKRCCGQTDATFCRYALGMCYLQETCTSCCRNSKQLGCQLLARSCRQTLACAAGYSRIAASACWVVYAAHSSPCCVVGAYRHACKPERNLYTCCWMDQDWLRFQAVLAVLPERPVYHPSRSYMTHHTGIKHALFLVHVYTASACAHVANLTSGHYCRHPKSWARSGL